MSPEQPFGFSTWTLYSEYMGFVLEVHGPCTGSTKALYCGKTGTWNQVKFSCYSADRCKQQNKKAPHIEMRRL